jgi:hypothetical protein
MSYTRIYPRRGIANADQARLTAIHEMPCICCTISGCEQLSRTEGHHITDKSYRRLSGGHQSTLPLCGWHHVGKPVPPGHTIASATITYGPSLLHTSKLFKTIYGTEWELLAQVNERIGLTSARPLLENTNQPKETI